MKYNKLYIAFIILIAGLMWGCEEYEDTIEPSPTVPAGNQGVYFPSSNISEFELEPSEPTEIELTIARTETSGSAEVPIKVEINTDEVFIVPEKVVFEDGEEEKSFTITFPDTEVGKPYDLKLLVEGDEYVNPYLSMEPTVSTSVTRIKWEPVEEQMVYIDGTFGTLFGVEYPPMYVNAEIAELGEVTKYRFKNPYKVPSGSYVGDDYIPEPDADGIFDGYYYNEPGDYDESKDYYVVIEVDEDGEVFMEANDIGVDWGYGMISIGSIYRNLSDDKESYPLGTLDGEVLTFPENSLYFSMADYNDGGKYPADASPTYIYLTKEAFILANMKIEDFNAVEYKEIEGELGEFASEAYSDSWNQTISKAIDIDEENEDSEYKDLYYLADLYADGHGLAFYHSEGGSVRIPSNQPIGKKAFGKEVYISPSESISSSVEVNSKGITVYTFGLSFHFEDGTQLGDFEETFFYSEEAVNFSKEDFVGDFNLRGPSQFSGEPAADMDVNIAEGEGENILVITGVDFAEEIIATFDPNSSIMSISPQILADYNEHDITLLTTDAKGASDEAILDFTLNMKGQILLAETSEADGYILYSESAGGYVDGYYDLVFERKATRSKSKPITTVNSLKVRSDLQRETIGEDLISNNFKILGKISPKKVRTNVRSTGIM